jgi:hypothetical protein
MNPLDGFYLNNQVDLDFDEKEFIKNHPDMQQYYKQAHKRNIDDKSRFFFLYATCIYPNISLDIVSFYSLNEVDESFDHQSYLESNPSAKDFYKEYCDENDITDRQRLFYHSFFYGSNNYSTKGLLELSNPEHLNIEKLADFERLSIDEFLPPHEQFVDQYKHYLNLGENIAKDSKIVTVALARDCDEHLSNSISRIQSLDCKESQIFIFENDSKDTTKQILKELSDTHKNIQIQCINNNREYLKNRSRSRTNALAEYRNICLEWVRDNCSDYDYVIVLDLDADLGFSVDGIYNSIGWFDSLNNAGGIGSYSLFLTHGRDGTTFAHYDSFAVRLNDWKPTSEYFDQNNSWFRHIHPLIGSEPFHLYSCFGGLAIYKTKAFLTGRYSGEIGSEHVQFHKDLYNNGYKMYLNPSSRFFSVYENYLNDK